MAERKVDAPYVRFPAFNEWKQCTVDADRWHRAISRLERHGEVSEEQLRRAQEVARRAAAVDTGAIEGLYPTDRGFTFAIATQGWMWEARLEEKGPKARSLIEAQLRAYEQVLDLATQAVPVAEAWIRAIHSEICKGQLTYTVQTPLGPQEQALPLGQYKLLPNNVVTGSGAIHSYAPVEMVATEMHRLCDELRSGSFLAASPVLQASYAHYALVVVHPFSDGNGRVARALASIYTYRAGKFPFLVLAEDKPEYLSSLAAADTGNAQAFVDFVFAKAEDAIRLIDQALEAAGAPRAEDAADRLRKLFATSGGFSHPQVDEAANAMLAAFAEEVQRQAKEWPAGQPTHLSIHFFGGQAPSPEEGFRRPLTKGQELLQIALASPQPAHASIDKRFAMYVPRDCGRSDELFIREITGEASARFGARVDELIPRVSTGTHLRLAMFVEGVLGRALNDLHALAQKSLKSQGF